jgi:hypothetical protein
MVNVFSALVYFFISFLLHNEVSEQLIKSTDTKINERHLNLKESQSLKDRSNYEY